MFFFLFATLGNSFVKEENESWLCVQSFWEKKKSQFKLLYLDNLEGERDNIT